MNRMIYYVIGLRRNIPGKVDFSFTDFQTWSLRRANLFSRRGQRTFTSFRIIGKASGEEEALRLKRERLKADLVEVEKQMSSGQAQDPSHDD